MSLFNFKNILVRELAWVMCSPNLLVPARQSLRHDNVLPLVWDADCRCYYQAFLAELQKLDQHPAALQAWMSSLTSTRLGIRFERYLAFWLSWIVPQASDLLPSVTLYQEETSGRTLGQLDFLWRDQERLSRHWEAAVKFYLYHPQQSGQQRDAAQWLGPNANDSFEAKLTRLLQHQIPIAQSAAAQRVVQARQWDLPLHSSVFLKGYLFYPVTTADADTASWRLGGDTRVLAPASEEVCGQRLSRAHLKGWWQQFPYRALPQVAPDSHWLVLPKRLWLAPLSLAKVDCAEQELSLYNTAQLQQYCESHFSRSQRSLMVAEMRQKHGQIHEIARGMLVHPDWPNLRQGPE